MEQTFSSEAKIYSDLQMSCESKKQVQSVRSAILSGLHTMNIWTVWKEDPIKQPSVSGWLAAMVSWAWTWAGVMEGVMVDWGKDV